MLTLSVNVNFVISYVTLLFVYCTCFVFLLKGASGEYGAMGEQGTPGADVSTIHDKIRKTANCFFIMSTKGYAVYYYKI